MGDPSHHGFRRWRGCRRSPPVRRRPGSVVHLQTDARTERMPLPTARPTFVELPHHRDVPHARREAHKRIGQERFTEGVCWYAGLDDGRLDWRTDRLGRSAQLSVRTGSTRLSPPTRSKGKSHRARTTRRGGIAVRELERCHAVDRFTSAPNRLRDLQGQPKPARLVGAPRRQRRVSTRHRS